MTDQIKKGLFGFAFLIIMLPYLQHRFEFTDNGELLGFYSNAEDANLSVKGWFDGSYQTAVNNYYNDHIGYRPTGGYSFPLPQNHA